MDNPLLNFNLNGLATHVELKTWDMLVTASLEALVVEDHCGGADKVKLMVAAGRVGEEKEGQEKFMEAVYKKVRRLFKKITLVTTSY